MSETWILVWVWSALATQRDLINMPMLSLTRILANLDLVGGARGGGVAGEEGQHEATCLAAPVTSGLGER